METLIDLIASKRRERNQIIKEKDPTKDYLVQRIDRRIEELQKELSMKRQKA